MTRYYVSVANAILNEPGFADSLPACLHLVDIGPGEWAPWGGGSHRCTFDDDDAPAELEGALVEPILQRHDDGTITVAERRRAA